MSLLDNLLGSSVSSIDKLADDATRSLDKFFSDAQKLGIDQYTANSPELDKYLYDMILRNYYAAKKKDIDEFNSAIYEQDPHSINARVEESANWAKRYRRSANQLFSDFRQGGLSIEKLEAAGEKLYKKTTSQPDIRKLGEILAGLRNASTLFRKVDKTISLVIAKVEHDITIDENNEAAIMRSSITNISYGDTSGDEAGYDD